METQIRQNVVIVLNYNDWEETTRFCNMVNGCSSIDKILIVDNKSTDESVERLNNLVSDKILLLVAEDNKGYSAGNNVGLRYILDNNIKGNIIISNPDIYFDSSNIDSILMPLNDEAIGVSTGLITMHGETISNYAWDVPSYWDMVTNLFLLTYKIKKILGLSIYHKLPKNEEFHYCSCVSGCFFCFTTETLQQVGLFDERTFLFGEEFIFGYRLKQSGKKACVVVKEKIEHDQHHSINKSSIAVKKERNWDLSSMLIYIKFYLRKGVILQALYKFLYKVSYYEQRLVLSISRFLGLYK